MIKFGLCGIVLVALATPAFAANKFYVVRDTTTKACSIVEQKPTGAMMKVVGPAHKTQAKVVGPAHKTQAMAEKTMKAAKACDNK